MKCPKCGSENVNLQAKKNTYPKVIWGSALALCGFGLMLFGIPGSLIGGVIGLIIGLILYAIMSTSYKSVMVCQNCGYCGKPQQ